MAEHKGLPVHGYVPQSGDKVAMVNVLKEVEERVLRHLDELQVLVHTGTDREWTVDPRWLAVARTHIQIGFMSANRAIFQPTRVNLPEDPGLPHPIPEDGG